MILSEFAEKYDLNQDSISKFVQKKGDVFKGIVEKRRIKGTEIQRGRKIESRRKSFYIIKEDLLLEKYKESQKRVRKDKRWHCVTEWCYIIDANCNICINAKKFKDLGYSSFTAKDCNIRKVLPRIKPYWELQEDRRMFLNGSNTDKLNIFKKYQDKEKRL